MIDPPTEQDLPAIIRDWRHLHAAAAFRCLLQDNRPGAQGHLSRINDSDTYHDIYHAAHLLAALAQHAYLEMDT
jgi:hypothetical protein